MVNWGKLGEVAFVKLASLHAKVARKRFCRTESAGRAWKASVMSAIRVAAGGIDFEVFETAAGGGGTGERLALCLHGFPEIARSWQHQAPVLAALGYRVWAVNQRGYGGTTTPAKMQDYAVERLMDDVANLIDASGATSVTLIAHDWGAIVAWLFATRRLRPLERLVIMNVPHPAVFRKRATLKQVASSWYMAFFQLPRLPEIFVTSKGGARVAATFKATSTHPENFTREDLAAYRANIMRPGGATGMINWYRALIRGGGSVRQTKLGYPKIDVPTLMLWGEDDAFLTKATTVGTDEYVTNLTLRYLPGISHWVQQDAPREVNAMLEAFLTGKNVPEYATVV